MENVSVQRLKDAGVHFGGRVSRWNPKMAPYVHGQRDEIHIIDLRATVRALLRAQNFLLNVAREGQQVLWVGTKRQVKSLVEEVGRTTGMPVVNERWLGGTLTNLTAIQSRLRRLDELEAMERDGSFEHLSRKQASMLRREQRKIQRNLSGLRDLRGFPAALVVVDPGREPNAIREARKMGVAVIGILDTDSDPDGIDIVIPGNDDALKSVRILLDSLASAVREGTGQYRERMANAEEPRAEPTPALGEADSREIVQKLGLVAAALGTLESEYAALREAFGVPARRSEAPAAEAQGEAHHE
ncbi:MAG: 30S ribosomal protein S2 [Planctomycetota bacterium]